VDNSGSIWRGSNARRTRDPDAGNYLPESRSILGSGAAGNPLSSRTEMTQALGYIAESWVYVEHDLELFFVDQLGVGKFDFPLGVHETNIAEAHIQNEYSPRRLANALIKETPEYFDYDYGGRPLQFLYDIVSYKGEREGYADVEVAYMVPALQLDSIEDGQGPRTWFDSHFVFQDEEFRRVSQASRRIGPIERPAFTLSGKDMGVALHTGMLDLQAPGGTYRTAIEVQDEATRRIGIYEQEHEIPDYSGDALIMSDIRLAVSITPADSANGPFIRNGLKIEPNPARLYQRADPVHFYYEIYNLTRNESGRTFYQVELEVQITDRRQNLFWRILKGIDRLVRRSDREQSVLMVFENEGNRENDFSYTSIDTGVSPAGAYEMSIRITDLHSGQVTSRTKKFVITNDRIAAFANGR